MRETITFIRALISLGVTVEQYREAVNNPDMSDEELAERLQSNQDRIQELMDRDHD